MTSRRDPAVGSPKTPWKALLGAAWDGLGLNTIILEAQDNALEGGEIQFKGGGNGGAPFATWILDSWTGSMRLFTGGIVKWTLDTLGNMGIAGNLGTENTKQGNVGHGINWAGFSHGSVFNTVSYALLQLNTGLVTRLNAASGGQIGLALNNADQWVVESSGHFIPAFDNTRDIARTALRLRDIFIAGETVGENGVNGNAANQGTFVNVETDVAGAGFEIGVNEQWEFDIFIPFLPGSTAGCMFKITAPALCTTAFTAFQTTTGVTAFSTQYLVTLNTNTSLFGTTAASHWIRLTGRISSGANAGSVKVRGTSGAVGTTIQIRDGVVTNARRKS